MKSLRQAISENHPAPITQQHKPTSLAVSNNRIDKVLQVFPKPTAFLAEFNFDSCLSKFDEYNKPELALTSGKLKLNELAAAYSRQTPISMIELWLLGMSNFMGWEVAPAQIRETALYLYEDNHFWNLAETTLFFKNLKKGRYGTFYGKFDGMKICMAARDYRIQRGQILSKLPDEVQKSI